MSIEINPQIKKIKFKKQLSFNELKEELKLLKKSYKDIFEWTIEVENTGLTFVATSSSNYIYNSACGTPTSCMYPGCTCNSTIVSAGETLNIAGNADINSEPLQN